MPECESCDNFIIREMSIFDWDVVEQILNDIPCVCDTCAFRMLFMYYHAKYKYVKEVINES